MMTIAMNVTSSTLLLLLAIPLPLLHPLHRAEGEDQQENHHLDDHVGDVVHCNHSFGSRKDT